MRHLLLLGLLSLGTANALESGSDEKILGYQPGKTGIIFQVKSGGCTSADDFTVEVTRAESKVTEVKLVRIRPDTCRPFLPTGIRFKLSNEKLGLALSEPYVITNGNGVVHGWVWE